MLLPAGKVRTDMQLRPDKYLIVMPLEENMSMPARNPLVRGRQPERAVQMAINRTSNAKSPR